MPLDLVMGLPPEEVNGNPNIEDFVAKQQQMADSAYRVTREQLHVAAERRKTSYDAKIKSATMVLQWGTTCGTIILDDTAAALPNGSVSMSDRTELYV